MRRFGSAARLSTKTMMGGTAAAAAGYGTVSPRSDPRARAIKLAAVGLLGLALLYGAHVLLIKSEVRYGLMIDAGSTGSRMHTFTFRTSGPIANAAKLKLVAEDFYPVKPGLSHYQDDEVAAAKSLEPLLERARQVVPEAKRADTPVYLRATAGLRAVGVHKAERILDEVRAYLGRSGFRFDGVQWASVLGGSDEGVYTWITVNYLMHRNPGNTVGILEMGGGSAQAAFVARESGSCTPETLRKQYAGQPVPLYAKSDLGFGLQKARATALTAFEASGSLKNNPCFNAGGDIVVKVPFEERSVSVSGSTGADGPMGNFGRCRKLLEAVVVHPRQNGTCACRDACGYDAVVRPKPIDEYVAIAFYIERTAGIGMQTPLRLKDIIARGSEVCSMTKEQVTEKYPDVANGEPSDLCMDLAFIAEHLEHGHGIKDDSNIKLHVKNKIDGFELGWSLGAMFDELSKLDT